MKEISQSVDETASFLGINLTGGFFSDLDLDRKPRTMVDSDTLRAIEYNSLLGSTLGSVVTRWTISRTGLVNFVTSMIRPTQDAPHIVDRQGAIQELEGDNDLRNSLRQLVENFSSYEDAASREGGGRESMMDIRSIVKNSISNSKNLRPKSQYLETLIGNIRSLEGSRIHRLSTDSISRQGGDIIPLRKMNWFVPTPVLVGSLSRFRLLPAIVGSAVTGAILYGLSQGNPGPEIVLLPTIAALGAGVISAMVEQNLVERPVLNEFHYNFRARRLYESLAEIDGLLTLTTYGEKLMEQGIETCFPEIVDSDRHSMKCERLVNVIAKMSKGAEYIPTERFDLQNNMHYFTGPNSAGKTTISKAAVAQVQMIGQAGGRTPMRDGMIVPADRIFYHQGDNDSQEHSEGGYGAQLAKGGVVFEKATPKSLAVVDDLTDGTDQKEVDRSTRDRFYGLSHTGANVVMISHRHDLVSEFRDANPGYGNYIRMEFEGNNPTRQVIGGISDDSMGELVAARVGQDRAGLEKLFRDRGLLANGDGLYDLKPRN